MKKVPHYDPTNDLVFKFVFGRDERKNVTLAFINDMTGREGRDAFVDLDFRTSELVPDKLDDKLGRLDIFGILDNNTRIDVEMQVINHRNMEKAPLLDVGIYYNAFRGGKGVLKNLIEFSTTWTILDRLA